MKWRHCQCLSLSRSTPLKSHSICTGVSPNRSTTHQRERRSWLSFDSVASASRCDMRVHVSRSEPMMCSTCNTHVFQIEKVFTGRKEVICHLHACRLSESELFCLVVMDWVQASTFAASLCESSGGQDTPGCAQAPCRRRETG